MGNVQEEMFVGLLPTASSLKPGDVVEGTAGKAYPRPWRVLKVAFSPERDYIEISYRELNGSHKEGVRVLRRNHPVDLRPPF